MPSHAKKINLKLINEGKKKKNIDRKHSTKLKDFTVLKKLIGSFCVKERRLRRNVTQGDGSPGSVLVWGGTVLVVDQLEEEEVEHDDDAGNGQPEDHRQTSQPGSSSEMAQNWINNRTEAQDLPRRSATPPGLMITGNSLKYIGNLRSALWIRNLLFRSQLFIQFRDPDPVVNISTSF